MKNAVNYSKVYDSKRKRLVWLDAVKGTAMLMVILVHAGVLPYPEIIFSGGVALFFCVSGFTCHDFSPSKQNVIKKAKRLLIPYFFYGTLLTILSLAALLIMHKDTEIVKRITAIFYARRYFSENSSDEILLSGGCTPLWFMPAMFCAYIYTYLTYWCHKKFHTLGTVIVSIIGFSIIILQQQTGLLFPWSLDVAVLGAVLIGMGHYLKEKIMTLSPWLIILISMPIYLIVNNINGNVNLSINIYGDIGVLSVLLVLILGITETCFFSGLWRWCENSKIADIFAYIGRHSLRLMCIHMFFLVTMKDIFEGKINFYIYTAMALIAVFIADYICEILSKRFCKGLL